MVAQKKCFNIVAKKYTKLANIKLPLIKDDYCRLRGDTHEVCY